MKRVVLFVATFAIGVAMAAPLYAQGATAEQGKKIFEREKCGMCHTATRNSLANVGSKLSDEQMREWIQNPKVAAQKSKSTAKPMMRSYEKLSKEDVDALIAYMKTMK